MRKLINLNIIPANGVICVSREDMDMDFPFRSGIQSDEAMGSFSIPRYIVIGTFDDGSVRAGGILTLNEINRHHKDYKYLFLRDQFLHNITIYDAMAFVRCDARYENEDSVKKMVYKHLVEAGVEIWEDAKEYLLPENDEIQPWYFSAFRKIKRTLQRVLK